MQRMRIPRTGASSLAQEVRSDRFRVRWNLLASVLLLLVPSVVLFWARFGVDEHLNDVHIRPDPVVMYAELREDWGQMPVVLDVRWGQAEAIAAPPWSGTITKVVVAPGDTVRSGDVLVEIDGIARIAAATPQPFLRRIARGDTGADVEVLQELLGHLRMFEGEADGTYGSMSIVAVKTWATELGVTEPDGAFDPAWVVWLPVMEFRVENVEARMGFPAPSPGTPLLIAPQPISEIRLQDPEGQPLSLSGEWVLLFAGTEIPLIEGAVGRDAFLILMSQLEPGSDAASAAVRRAVPLKVLELPATAVVSNEFGKTCVWVPGNRGFDPREVTLGTGQTSRVNVLEGVNSGDQVLINPADVLEDTTCP